MFAPYSSVVNVEDMLREAKPTETVGQDNVAMTLFSRAQLPAIFIVVVSRKTVDEIM
jgi:hypothetical protein